MIFRKAATIGGFTLISRLAGFVRDLVMAAVLGAGPLADAFMVAFRLPNHFRAILAEGAFNAAFVPRYSTTLAEQGARGAAEFAATIQTLVLIANTVLLLIGTLGAGWFVTVLAPGYNAKPEQFALVTDLTRITFPYLFCLSLVTFYGGVLNAHGYFKSAAGAPILLNICLVVALLYADAFPSAAHACAWGVLAAGGVQFVLMYLSLARSGLTVALGRPVLSPTVRDFLRRFGPAVVGASGVQIAMFADTIIATFLPAGSVSYLYYADRLYQLPLAIIGIALGTVLLPDLSKSTATGDDIGFRRTLTHSVTFAVGLGVPFAILFVGAADWILAVLFGRGSFDGVAVNGSAGALQAYAIGLPAAIVLRSLTSAFHARGDTRTPVLMLFVATIANIALKLAFVGSLAHVALALGTAAGAWINAALLFALLWHKEFFNRGREISVGIVAIATSAITMTLSLFLFQTWSEHHLSGLLPGPPLLAPLTFLGLLSTIIYVGTFYLFWTSMKPKESKGPD